MPRFTPMRSPDSSGLHLRNRASRKAGAVELQCASSFDPRRKLDSVI